MNHLRELLDSLPDVTVDRDIPTHKAHKLLTQCKREAENAVCFWMGDLDTVKEMRPPDAFTRLPFPVCWFEGQIEGEAGAPSTPIGMIAVEGQIDDYTTTVIIFCRHKRQWMLMGLARIRADGAAGFMPTNEGLDGLCMAIQSMKAFCFAMNCTNVAKREHLPDAPLRKKRAARGKAPLFSYWTLELVRRNGPTASLGGTHAGPRVHLRRGHPRQYAPGKWTWVNACAVGNPALGMVHKDYDGSSLADDGDEDGEVTPC